MQRRLLILTSILVVLFVVAGADSRQGVAKVFGTVQEVREGSDSRNTELLYLTAQPESRPVALPR